MTAPVRCRWATDARELDQQYHDTEWGVPTRDERALFELLILEGAQAGLSWSTVLQRREGYRRLFASFDVAKVAALNARAVARIAADAAVIRSRAKIESAVGNARAVVALHEAGTSLSELLWSFVEGRPLRQRRRSHEEVPGQTPHSIAMAKELRRRGFTFVGPTICYALMQAAGLVNDHLTRCFRWAEIEALP